MNLKPKHTDTGPSTEADISWSDLDTIPAYINGVYMPLADAKISVLDRGFMFADGVYEVVPIYSGELFRWPAHLDRLRRSLDGLFFAPDCVNMAHIEEVAQHLASTCAGRHASLYLQITRGNCGQRDHTIPANVQASVVMWLVPLPALDRDPASVRLKTLTDIRWQWCHLKTVSLLGNVLLRHCARQEGYDDAFLIRDDRVTEATAANFFLVDNDTLLIPDSNDALLPGITRQVIIDLAEAAGIAWKLCQPPMLPTVLTAAEVWLCSSTKLMLPVGQVDDCVLPDHKNSGIGLRLLDDFIKKIEAYHPQQDSHQ